MAVRILIHNIGLSTIRLPKEGHVVDFPSTKGNSKRVGVAITDLEKPSATTILVPPFGTTEVGTDAFRPNVTMVAGKGLENEPFFDVCLIDELGRSTKIRYLLPDTIALAVPNAQNGKWEYPLGISLILNPREVTAHSWWGKWLRRRASKRRVQDVAIQSIWPKFQEDSEPPEAPTYKISPTVSERESVVAFIDVLGFKELMESADDERRSTAIRLLERLVEHSSNHGIEIRDLGLGAQIVINPEVSTFSDNVVISFPLHSVKRPTPVGSVSESASSFMTNFATLCISTYWQGLNLGLLFRGGISIGRLYHAENVVAGAGLVRAVAMENDAIWPRIAVDPTVLEATDEHGRPIIDESLRTIFVQDPEDGVWQLDTMSFHIGVWWDYFHFLTGKPSGTWHEVRHALESIRDRTTATITRLASEAAASEGDNKKALLKAVGKWEWFKRRFEEAQKGEDWAHVWKDPTKPAIYTVGPSDTDIVQPPKTPTDDAS